LEVVQALSPQAPIIGGFVGGNGLFLAKANQWQTQC